MCALKDGTVVAAGYKELKRWDVIQNKLLQVYTGHSLTVYRVIELKSNAVIVSASADKTVKLWSVLSAECLRTLTQHAGYVNGLVKLKGGYFASGSLDQTIRVWDDEGNNLATYQIDYELRVMTTLEDGSIVTGDSSRIEIRRP